MPEEANILLEYTHLPFSSITRFHQRSLLLLLHIVVDLIVIDIRILLQRLLNLNFILKEKENCSYFPHIEQQLQCNGSAEHFTC